VDWQTAGNRTVKVNYENSYGCNAVIPANLNVTVLPIPAPTINGDNQVCQAETGVTYTTELNYETYTWAVTGGTITSGAGTNEISVTWTTPGAQMVSVNCTNAQGCAAPAPTVMNVTVAPKPGNAGSVNGNSSVCAGTNGVTYAVSPITNATGYEWTLPTGVTIASGAGTNIISVNFASNAVSGIIKVAGTNDCGSGASSPNFNVTVNPIPPTPVITQSGDTLKSSATAGNQWYFNGSAIPGATGQIHVAVYAGNYYVKVTLNGCSSAQSNTLLVLPVEIGDQRLSSILEIFPNPSFGQFNIQIQTLANQVFTLEIYNNLGSLVWKRADIAVNETFTCPVDLKSCPAGVYMIALRNGTNQLVKKMIIMH
jgi:hypothetical protein